VTSYNLLLVGELHPSHLAVALASLSSLATTAVDVSSADSDDRNWQAAISCTYERAGEDITWLLDIYFSEAVTAPPGESKLAAHLAEHLGIIVLYPAAEAPPSAYWLAAPGGLRTRARVYDQEKDDRVIYKIDAVEKSVPALPKVSVAPMPEVIREHQVRTPLTDELHAWLGTQIDTTAAAEDLWFARTRLGAWESLTVRMATGWPPDGWYPAEFYREDLETRDDLAGAVERLPVVAAARFEAVLRKLDEKFLAATVKGDLSQLSTLFGVSQSDSLQQRAWWWQRLPEPTPWPETS
jgi:hypothetical protein